MRTRQSDTGCQCRVPISECCVPQGLRDGDALEYLGERGVDVGPDHQGRLSIRVADAQKLWDDASASAADEVAAMSQLFSAVYSANARRRDLFSEVFGETLRGTVGRNPSEVHAAARTAALDAIAEFDKTLPKAVIDRLDALPTSPVYAL